MARVQAVSRGVCHCGRGGRLWCRTILIRWVGLVRRDDGDSWVGMCGTTSDGWVDWPTRRRLSFSVPWMSHRQDRRVSRSPFDRLVGSPLAISATAEGIGHVLEYSETDDPIESVIEWQYRRRTGGQHPLRCTSQTRCLLSHRIHAVARPKRSLRSGLSGLGCRRDPFSGSRPNAFACREPLGYSR